MLALLVLQIAATGAAAPEARVRYEPYRRCLLARAGKIDAVGKTDDAVIGAARQMCMAANLGGGSQALFAEMRAGVPQQTAVEHVAAIRIEIEAESLIAIRAASAAKP